MKKWIAFGIGVLVAANVFAQEQPEQTNKYEINGGISGEYQGKVYLVREERMHGPQTRIDSCEVTDGRFQFTGEAPQHSVIYFIQSKDGQLAPIFLEPGNIRTSMRADYFLGARSEGTINNNFVATAIRCSTNIKKTASVWQPSPIGNASARALPKSRRKTSITVPAL